MSLLWKFLLPFLSSDLPQARGLKRPATARADEWASYDSDSDSDDAHDKTYDPMTSTTTATTEDDAETRMRDASNARRRENYAQGKRYAEEPPRKVVKLSVSPKSIARPMPIPPRENVGAKPEFMKGQRVLARDGYSSDP